MKPPYIKLYVKDVICDSLDMSDEELGQYIKAFFKAYRTGTIPKAFSDHSLFKELHSSKENYEKVCEKNTNNGKRGGRPKKNPFENTTTNTDTSETQWVNFENPNETQKKPTLVNQEPITKNQEPEKNITPYNPPEGGCGDLPMESHEIPSVPKGKKKPAEKVAVVLDIPHFIPEDLLLDFFAYRKQIKKPMTDRAKELLISKIIKLYNDGNDPTKLLEVAIERGWQTVFETHETKGRNSNGENWNNLTSTNGTEHKPFGGHQQDTGYAPKLSDYERKILHVRRNLGLGT